MEITPELTPSYRELFTQLYAKIIISSALDNYRDSTNYDFIRQVLDYSSDEYYDMLRNVYSVMSKILPVENIVNNISSSISSIGGSAGSLVNSVATHVFNLSAGIGTVISQVVSYIWEQIKNFLNNIWFTIQPYLMRFWDNIRDVAYGIWNFLTNVWESLGKVLGSLWTTLRDFFSDIWEKIKEKAAGAWSTLNDWLRALWEFITVTIPKFFTDLFADIKAFSKIVYDVIKDIFKWLIDLGVKLIDYLDKSTWAKFAMFAAAPTGFVGAYATIKAVEIFTHYREAIVLGKGIVPEDAPLAALGAITFATAAGVAAHFISVATEVFYPLKNLGISYIAGIVGELASYGRVIAASMGVLITLSVRQPFEYWIKKILRPTLPAERTLIELVQRREITIDDFRKFMAYNGYSEEWITSIQNAAFREPRLTELMYVYEDGNISDDWLTERIRKYGIADRDVDNFLMAINLRVMRTQRNDFYYATMKLYANGFLSDSQFDDNLEVLSLRKDAKDTAKRAADLQYLFNKINDSVTLYVDKYKKEVISYGELTTALTGLGISSDKVTDLVDKATIDKKPKPVAVVKPAIDTEYNKMVQKMIPLYIQQYRYELIKSADLKTKLRSLGLLDEYINLVVSVEDAKKVKTATRLSDVALAKRNRELEQLFTTEYIEQYRKDLIDKDQLQNYLLQIGLDAGIVNAMVAVEEIKKYTPATVVPDRAALAAAKALSKKYYDLYIQAFRKGFIDEDTLTSYLNSLDIPAEEVQVTVQLEKIRAAAPAKIAPTELITEGTVA